MDTHNQPPFYVDNCHDCQVNIRVNNMFNKDSSVGKVGGYVLCVKLWKRIMIWTSKFISSLIYMGVVYDVAHGLSVNRSNGVPRNWRGRIVPGGLDGMDNSTRFAWIFGILFFICLLGLILRLFGFGKEYFEQKEKNK